MVDYSWFQETCARPRLEPSIRNETKNQYSKFRLSGIENYVFIKNNYRCIKWRQFSARHPRIDFTWKVFREAASRWFDFFSQLVVDVKLDSIRAPFNSIKMELGRIIRCFINSDMFHKNGNNSLTIKQAPFNYNKNLTDFDQLFACTLVDGLSIPMLSL